MYDVSTYAACDRRPVSCNWGGSSVCIASPPPPWPNDGCKIPQTAFSLNGGARRGVACIRTMTEERSVIPVPHASLPGVPALDATTELFSLKKGMGISWQSHPLPMLPMANMGMGRWRRRYQGCLEDVQTSAPQKLLGYRIAVTMTRGDAHRVV